jgi:uncharacterized protein
MKNLNTFEWVALVLVAIGGINWGLIGLFNLDLVSTLFGTMSILTRVVYVLVGVSGIYTLVFLSTKAK